MQSFTRRIADELAAGIAHELRLDETRSALATTWAHGIVGMVQAAGDHWLTSREVDRPTLVEALTGLLWGEFAGLSGSAATVAGSAGPQRMPDGKSR
jgi:hypothetical protein